MTNAVETLRDRAANGERPTWAAEPRNLNQQHPRPRSARAPYVLTTRKPRTGCSWPFLLVAGGEFSGKSYEAAVLAASGRFGRTWWLPIGEDPEQYQEIADYDIVNHDGSYYEIASAVDQIAAAVATVDIAAGELPHLVVIDSGSQLWSLLSAIAEGRALKTDDAREARMRNVFADVTIGSLHWNAVTKMWQRIITKLITMKAVVVMTARAKENVAIVRGRPDNDAPRVFRPAVQSETPYSANAYIRLDREMAPMVLGARLVKGGVRPGRDEPFIFDGQPHPPTRPYALDDFSLERIVFGMLKFDPAAAYVREIAEPRPDLDEPDAPAAGTVPAGASEAPGQISTAGDVTVPEVTGREAEPRS